MERHGHHQRSAIHGHHQRSAIREPPRAPRATRPQAALKLCEVHLPADAGNEHPLLHHTIGELAACYAAKEEPIAAEGLYRTAVDGLLGGAGALQCGAGAARGRGRGGVESGAQREGVCD
eukprot:1689837-Prymnesium_polylepis.1